MHAYLLIANSEEAKKEIESLAEKIQAEVLEYPLKKVEDVRSLNNLLRLSFDKPTLIAAHNIHEATTETLNAFLKSLEEPQENIFFVLTATSIRKVLPTIVSRCQIIKIKRAEFFSERVERGGGGVNIDGFLTVTMGGRLLIVDKIRDREKAVEFAENLVNSLHSKLHGKEVQYMALTQCLEIAQKTLTRLKGNGNVNLQLSNLVINFGQLA